MRLFKKNFLLTMAMPALAGLAIFATASTTQADVITWAAGAPGGTSGGSVSFDGLDDELPGEGFLETGLQGGFLGGDYTVSMWLRTSDIARQQFAVGTTNRSLHLGTDNSGLFQGHWGNDAAGTTLASDPLVNDEWFHATFTYDADGGLYTPEGGTETVTGVHSIFLNGVEIATAPVNDDGRADGPNFQNPIIIGSRRNGTDARQQWLGEVDDVAFFDSVLSDADIATLDDITADPLALGANAYYDFEDDQFGTTAAVQTAAGENAFGAGTIQLITANAVPEPSSLALLACMSVAGLVRRKRS